MEEEQAAAITRNNIDEILTLFELYWFHHLILFSLPPPRPRPPPPPNLPEPHAQPPSMAPQPIRHRRTRSDVSNSTFLPPPMESPRLQTILSGKESLDPIQSSQPHQANIDAVKRRRQQQNRLSRSMSELELEELKGLTDLGFNFSDTDGEADPTIEDVVPGLRNRRGKGVVEVAVRRPYLSEAWGVRDEAERRRVLKDWSVLANGEERDIKEQLRRWAHAVASDCSVMEMGSFGSARKRRFSIS